MAKLDDSGDDISSLFDGISEVVDGIWGLKGVCLLSSIPAGLIAALLIYNGIDGPTHSQRLGWLIVGIFWGIGTLALICCGLAASSD
jgi:hypothetical protein